MQTLSAILIGLSWLAILLLIIGVGLVVYALVRALRTNDPWGWREIGEELEREAKKED
jgi:hypothetical protein